MPIRAPSRTPNLTQNEMESYGKNCLKLSYQARKPPNSMRARSRTRALSSRREGETHRLRSPLLASARNLSGLSLIQHVCREGLAILCCESVEYWELETPDKFVHRHHEGRITPGQCKNALKLEEAPALLRALNGSVTILANNGEIRGRNCFLVPVRPKAGPKGIFVFVQDANEKRNKLNRQTINKAEALAGGFEAALNSDAHLSKTEPDDTGVRDSMAVTADLKPSLLLPEFVSDFTVRAATMLGARMAFLALSRGTRLETVFPQDINVPTIPDVRKILDTALTKAAAKLRGDVRTTSAKGLLGTRIARALNWKHLWLIRLESRENHLLGLLCLVDLETHISESDRNLIHAVAGHASIALENSRLFSRIEQSKRQWVEDFDAIHDLIVVHDYANRILRINRSLAQMLGSQPSELVGAKMNVVRVFAKNGARDGCPFCSDTEKLAEGTVLSAGAHAYLVSTSRIGAGPEEGSRIIHVLKDITEQRGYQAQLKRERDFNTNILNHTQSMILVLDTAGLISYANRRCYEAGFRKRDLLGRQLTDFVPRERRPLIERAFQSTLRGSAAESLELPFLYGNRSTGQVSISMSPMRDESGEVNSVVVVMTDITDARVLQAQLRHSEKMAALGQLVSGVAHEINNPLASIIGYSDLLLENPNVPGNAKDELNIVLKEAERTKEIVQNLLRFARQMPSRRERLDAHAILRQVVQLRTYGAANEGVEVIEKLSEGLSQIFGDADQLQQVFLNILNNAYDAVRDMKRPGRIEIFATNREGFVEIAIRDNGSGVSDTERIFEPFYTTKEVGKGTGLGLSICYGIVREHGGEIFCTNNAGSPGCTVFVKLPAASENVSASVAEIGR